jgi:pyruvate formate lyase activating enzyme
VTTHRATITNIQGYSIHDGPGIRTVVFIKGCPLRCLWCANPENLTASVQIGFIKNLCKTCGRCGKTCRYDAIIPGEGYRINKDKCVSCGDCVDACYYDALVRYGELKTAEETFLQVRKDKMFYDSSGGGVTVSGGEPLLNPDFVYELFSLCKNEAINTCIETCGYVPQKAFETVLPVTDYFLYDIKLIDPVRHKKYTGCDNELILENARYLVKSGADVLFRQPLIPGINDTDDNIQRTSEFMLSLGEGGNRLQLMPYHRAGTSKYNALNQPYLLEDIKPMSAEQIETVQNKYTEYGISCSISK